MKWNQYLLTLVFLTGALHISAQEKYDDLKEYTKAELLEDLSYLKTYLDKAHPGLYWYSSKSDFSTAYSKIKRSLNDPMNELEFLNLIGSLNNSIKCVHSDIRPSRNYNLFWKDSVKLIPINIRKVKTEYIVYQNLSKSSELNFGTKLIAINEMPIDEIINRLLPFIPADGDNQTRKYNALQKGFYRYYSYYIDASSETFKIIYEDELGKPAKIEVEGIKKNTFDERRKSLEGSIEQSPPVSFEFLENNFAAVLKVSSFRHDLMEKNDIFFEDYITSFFKQLEGNKYEHLIVDLRDNGGGYSEYGAILFSFLTDTSFQYCKNQIVTTDSLIEGIEYDIPETFKDFPNGVLFEDGEYKWTKHSVLGWRQPSEFNFSGNVFFIINGGCASTTSEFAALARGNEIGSFIGEEVGGCYAGNSGGVLGWIELPNTKLKLRIAMVKYEINTSKPVNKRGVIPDYEIEYTINDVIEGNDLEMGFLIQRIEELNSTRYNKK